MGMFDLFHHFHIFFKFFMQNWKIYYQKHSNREPREQLLKALSFCVNKENALDLGSGNLIESKAILDNGFKKVIAVDNEPEVKIFVENLNDKRLDFRNDPFQKYIFPEFFFDLINAEFALPFYGKENFLEFFNKINSSLRNKGIFTGQFFGVKDSWNKINSDLIFHTKKQVIDLLSIFEIIEFSEIEKDSLSASGEMKHWHIFNFIVKKK